MTDSPVKVKVRGEGRDGEGGAFMFRHAPHTVRQLCGVHHESERPHICTCEVKSLTHIQKGSGAGLGLGVITLAICNPP